MSDAGLRVVPVLGLATMLALAWLLSSDRRRFPWRIAAWGVGLQLALGALLLRTGIGRGLFTAVNAAVNTVLGYTESGVRFVFGPLLELGFSFALGVLPVIVFMGSVFGILYHLGAIQPLVRGLAAVLSRSFGTSGAESLAAAANVFVGMTEAPLLVRPYVERMTRSELFAVMTTGMATVAGSVLVAYAQMLGGGDFAGHLVTASLLSAPAGLCLAKIIVPETQTPETGSGSAAAVGQRAVNLIDAAAEGALAALRLAVYVGALLVAFIALIAMANDAVGFVGARVGAPELRLETLLGIPFVPLAWLMGMPWADAREVGSLLGVKTVLNEFLAYRDLARLMEAEALAPRSAVIASYALCGFANFGSLAILLGGLGGLAPSRRPELARMGLRSIAGGTLAALMTGCVAGLLLPAF